MRCVANLSQASTGSQCELSINTTQEAANLAEETKVPEYRGALASCPHLPASVLANLIFPFHDSPADSFNLLRTLGTIDARVFGVCDVQTVPETVTHPPRWKGCQVLNK